MKPDTPGARYLDALEAAGVWPLDELSGGRLDRNFAILAGQQVCNDARVDHPGISPRSGHYALWQVLDGAPHDRDQQIRLAFQYLCPDLAQVLADVDAGIIPEAAPMTQFDDSTYKIGPGGIAPGRYRTDGPVDGCYWERVDSAGKTLDNGFIAGAPQVEVEISASDGGFHSERCGRWTLVT